MAGRKKGGGKKAAGERKGGAERKSEFPVRVTRDTYPRPEYRFPKAKIGLTWRDSKADFPPTVEAPQGAPNVVLVLLDDVGYGWSSVTGGLVRMPTAERLAKDGLQYCAFHTTALCSPTRAALLTGRNHHTVSTGVIEELATGYPGYTGIIPKSCATLAELLSQNGFSTGWWGKNHNVPDNMTSRSGPFTHWPTRQGFDYFYGFIGGETDQFFPALYRDTEPVEASTSPEEGYHLTRDLADDCIAWMKTQKSIAPERPFFVYFSTGAAHAPHQPPLDWRGRNKGRFDMGWDRYREETLRRQLELGVVPAGTELTARPEEIPAWDSYSEEEKRVLAREAENYADFLEHTDFEVGRLRTALEELGQLEDTLFIYVIGDNGSSGEGTLGGTINELICLNGIMPPITDILPRVDEIGLPGTSPHYAVGWAWAGDTPFQWTKQVASHFGGTRNPMIVSWPNWIADKGAKRFQFHHCIDVVPTVLEVCGIKEPVSVNGVAQKPIEGVSLAYTFDREAADAPTQRERQYFEMFGHRALYADGWIACARHGRLPWQPVVLGQTWDFEQDKWELYNLDDDYSQAQDLAEQHPEKLRELQRLFDVEAARHDVFPLDDRFTERFDVTQRPGFFYGRPHVEFGEGFDRLPEGSAPKLNNITHRIRARVETPDPAEGVIVCLGGDTAGWSLFLENGRLRYHYNWFDTKRYDVIAPDPLPPGSHELGLDFINETDQVGGPATVRLVIDGESVAEGKLDRQVPARFSVETLDVGRDTLSPVCRDYADRRPFPFNGKIHTVAFDFEGGPELTREQRLEQQARME